MAGTKDLEDNRQQRPSMGPLGSSFQNRPHAHSVSAGTLNPTYRVNRRKSSSSMAGVNVAALAAAAKQASTEQPVYIGRVKEEHADTLGRSPATEGHFEIKSAVRLPGRGQSGKGSSALVDGPPLPSLHENTAGNKAKARRASEGTRLARSERRRSTAGELRCDKCGKGYKHGSCLQKHLWEHTPEWTLTSKLLISKHQQVQLLEAASVLVNMNTESPAINESAIQESESSDSPAASGSSELHEDDASSRTSTPSQLEEPVAQWKGSHFNRPKRQDSYNNAYSRSYQSASGLSFDASSAPNDANDMYYYRHSPSKRRPSTTSYAESEDRDLTAAAESLLSCSLGTPKNGPRQMLPDVPPVPPLPAKFQQHASRPVSYGYHTDVEMSDGERQHRGGLHSRGRDEEDEGMFGGMEQ